MADYFVNSTFDTSSGTLVQSLPPDLAGCTWTKISGPDSKVDTAGHIYSTGFDSNYAASAVTKNGYYSLEWDVIYLDSSVSGIGIYAFWDPVAVTFFQLLIGGQGAPSYTLATEGGNTLFDAQGTNHGSQIHCRWRLAAGRMQFYANNVLIFDVTYEPTAWGLVGFNMNGSTNSTGMHLDNFQAYIEDTGDPFDLPGTQIEYAITPVDLLTTYAHCLSERAVHLAELYFWRDAQWQAFPIGVDCGPDTPIVLTQKYKEPDTLDVHLRDSIDGLLTPSNQNSAYNLNLAGDYDALIDEARKILLRVGTRCYANIAPAGAFSEFPLTSGTKNILDGFPYVNANGYPNQSLSIASDLTPETFTLGWSSPTFIAHAAMCFSSWPGTPAFPDHIEFGVVRAGVTHWLGKRAFGGALGDYAPDANGKIVPFIQADINQHCDAISIRLYGNAGGPISVNITQILVWGGASVSWLGANLFTGFLGDSNEFTPQGSITLRATGMQKKMADNAEAYLTKKYENQDLADIAFDLLTNSQYWGLVGTYSEAFLAADIAWPKGAAYTNFPFPRWQGTSNTILGYIEELWRSIGWHLYTSGSGRINAFQPPQNQYTPDRICTAGPDATHDVVGCVRHYDSKDLRNVCHVATTLTGNGLSGDTPSEDPNSIARYGRRSMYITDGLANTASIRTAIGTQVVREYAWRLFTLTNTIIPDYRTAIKQVFAFRAPLRPKLWAQSSREIGQLRAQELFSLEGIQHKISYGKWRADCEWRPYFPLLINPVGITTISSAGGSTSATLSWGAYEATYAANLKVYYSQTSASGPWTTSALLSPTATSDTITGLTLGQPVWAYVVAVDVNGYESRASSILTMTVGSGGTVDITGYKVSDLAAIWTTSALVPGVVGPDALGYYTYEFVLNWTVPASGMTRFQLYWYQGSAPSDPNLWNQIEEWHGPLIPAGHEIQAPTVAGLSQWYARVRTPAAFASGANVYFLMLTYTDENNPIGAQNSNTPHVTMP